MDIKTLKKIENLYKKIGLDPSNVALGVHKQKIANGSTVNYICYELRMEQLENEAFELVNKKLHKLSTVEGKINIDLSDIKKDIKATPILEIIKQEAEKRREIIAFPADCRNCCYFDNRRCICINK